MDRHPLADLPPSDTSPGDIAPRDGALATLCGEVTAITRALGFAFD